MSKKGKLKRSVLDEALNKGWHPVEGVAPSYDDMAIAVSKHNRGYEGEVVVLGTPSSQLPIHYGGGTRGGDYGRGKKWSAPADTTTWHCEVKDVEGCPIAEPTQVEFPYDLWSSCIELAQDVKTEWLAYLTGELNADTGRARITGMYFPPQAASGGHVERTNEDFTPQAGTMGALHSHVNMGAFWSATDKEHANWPVEIVINSRGEYEMLMRIKLGCGRYSRVKGKVVLVGAKASDIYRTQLESVLNKTVVCKECGKPTCICGQTVTSVSVTTPEYPGIFGGGIT